MVADLKLALTEACSNSVRHAYDEGRAGRGRGALRARRDENLSVEVLDEGSGFDPELLEVAPERLDEGGLGIAIIRALVDELEIGPRERFGLLRSASRSTC